MARFPLHASSAKTWGGVGVGVCSWFVGALREFPCSTTSLSPAGAPSRCTSLSVHPLSGLRGVPLVLAIRESVWCRSTEVNGTKRGPPLRSPARDLIAAEGRLPAGCLIPAHALGDGGDFQPMHCQICGSWRENAWFVRQKLTVNSLFRFLSSCIISFPENSVTKAAFGKVAAAAALPVAAVTAPAFALDSIVESLPSNTVALEVQFGAYLAVALGTLLPCLFLINLYIQTESRKAGRAGGQDAE